MTRLFFEGGFRMKVLLMNLVILCMLFNSTYFPQLLPPGIPREETLIVQSYNGRAPNAGNFNIWATWVVNDRGIHNLMIEPLWYSEYALGKIINALAEEQPIYNHDFTELTIKLRKGVFWSDGIPFTADDLIYTIELNKKTPGMSYHFQMQQVKELVKIDDYTVTIKLKEPNARFHTYFLDRWGALRPLPKHVFEKIDDPLSFNFNPPVGTGPYVLHSYDPGGYWTLWERRKDWDRSATGLLFGMPKPRYVLFIVYGTPEKEILAMAQHQLDVTETTIEALKVIIERVKTARAWRKDFPWVININPFALGVVFNTAKEPFKNADVRWALTLAINAVELSVNAYDGVIPICPIHIPLTLTYYDWYYKKIESWLMSFELEIEKGEKFRPYDPTISFKLAEYAKKKGYPVPSDSEEIRRIFGPGWWKYAPDIAEKLLKKHGFFRNREGKWCLPNGEVWKITITTWANPIHPYYKVAFAVAQEWLKFGIDAVVQPTEMLATLSGRGEFDVIASSPASQPWGGHPDPYRVLEPFHSRNVVPIGQNAPWGNYGRWSNPKMDEIIETIMRTPWEDTERLINLGIEGLKLLVKEMPAIPTFTGINAAVYDEYYWTNWPTAENLYCQPLHHWPNFAYMLPFLKPVTRK